MPDIPPRNLTPRLIAESQLLQRGWSRRLIAAILGNPSATKPNPHRRSTTMRLWLESDVIKAEEDHRFLEYRAERKKRSERAKQIAEQRARATLDDVAAIEITVPVMPTAELEERAIDHTILLRIARGKDDGTPPDKELPAAVKQRWMVNYLRHQLTSYEHELRRMYKRIAAPKARTAIKIKILAAIGQTYPELAEECRRQAEIADDPA